MGRVTKKSLVQSITHGFTLIELIIAVGIIALILPAVFNIFFAITRQQLVLVAYQTMKLQGDSVQRNIKNLLQNRAAYITDNTYDYSTMNAVCPPITTPTPTVSTHLYFKDTDEVGVHLYSLPNPTPITDTVASVSAGITYYLSSPEVTITNLSFTCSRTNEFSPPIITTSFTVSKSAVYQSQDISLPYSFSVRLKNY